MQILIDCYGHPATSERFQKETFKKKAYLVDKADENTTYVCFDLTAKRAVHRIIVNDNITEITWAFGTWANRASLNYTSTLNMPISVDETDIA